jgi:hypothetical protein
VFGHPEWADHPIVRTIAKKHADCANFYWDAAVALAINGISGDYAEFGSAGAHTLGMAHDAFRDAGVERHLWAFDSFAGLPPSTDPRDQHAAFAPDFGSGGIQQFHADCADHGVPAEAYTTVEGYYDQTLPALGTGGAPLDIALAYVDCNLYTSTVSVLEFLKSRLKHGMIIAFDDYYCWSPTQLSGERAAVHEFLREHPEWNFHPYKEIHWAGCSFVVENADLLR